MKKGVTIIEILILILIVAATWGSYNGFLSLRRHWVSQGAMYAMQIAAQPTSAETQVNQSEPEDMAKTEQALARACFKEGSDYGIVLQVSQTKTAQMPVKEKLWREISPGDYVDVDVPDKGTVSVQVVKKYRRLNPVKE